MKPDQAMFIMVTDLIRACAAAAPATASGQYADVKHGGGVPVYSALSSGSDRMVAASRTDSDPVAGGSGRSRHETKTAMLKHDHWVDIPGTSPDDAVLLSPENRDSRGRYPLRVRTLYFFRRSPTSFTVIARQPELGLALG